MATYPFFSIVIPTFNRAADLQFALYCLLHQDFKDFEIVISDNCSTDNTPAVIRAIKDKRIRYVKMKKNTVFSLNLKNAIKYARGQYIFFHSDDDFLLYANSLNKIAKKIKEKKAGYIRVGYICMAPEKNGIFSFKLSKRFVQNEYLYPLSDNNKVVAFIVDSDHYFITGLVFKNLLPKNVCMVTSEHAPWMDMLFYAAKNFGACYISESIIVASWSVWRNSQDGTHPVYTLIHGKLESENYFHTIKRKLSEKRYEIFLHSQLINIYVRLFPLIKVKIGNKKLLLFAKRIREVDPTMYKTLRYWGYLLFALAFPRVFFKKLRDFYLGFYIRVSRVYDEKKILKRLKNLEREYQITTGKKEVRFNF